MVECTCRWGWTSSLLERYIMTRIRTIRDIVVPIPNGTHTIQRGTYFYTLGDEAAAIADGVPIVIPARRDHIWLFVNEDIEIVEDPIPF